MIGGLFSQSECLDQRLDVPGLTQRSGTSAVSFLTVDIAAGLEKHPDCILNGKVAREAQYFDDTFEPVPAAIVPSEEQSSDHEIRRIVLSLGLWAYEQRDDDHDQAESGAAQHRDREAQVMINRKVG